MQKSNFLELIARLYGMEDTYRREKLTPDEIYRRRNSKKTTEIIEKLRTELYDLLANPEESRSELMSKALNYLKTFWNQIFAYRNDGEYSIDNMAAERAIRPITVQRLCCTPHNLPYVGKIFMLTKYLIYCIIEYYDICSQHKYYLESHKN